MNIEQFDSWLQPEGPVAVIVREELEPVLGSDSVLFPPTFAPPEGSKEAPSYVIDKTPEGDIALIDTVGAQANRIEPLFKRTPYSELVPDARVKVGAREVSLFDAGHRAADAIVRFSDRWTALRAAFLSIRDQRNAVPLAKLAPTSLVFGVWDSRDTQVKLPRLIGSTIRGYQVQKLTRSAQFFSALEKDEVQDLGTQDFLSNVGLNDAPAGRTEGGVIARGGVRREAQLNLIALRALSGEDGEATLTLQRYILGLALVALTARPDPFLREGCLLTTKEGSQPELGVVGRDGTRNPFLVDEEQALGFAKAAAAAFVPGPAWTATFDPDAVKKSADKKKEDKAKKGK